jgi:hypothetical protein
LAAGRRLLTPFTTGAALALAAGLALAPPAARADCAAHSFSLAGLDGPFAPAAAPAAARPAAPRGPKPCTGPHCRARRDRGADPLPSEPPTRGDEWGCVLTFAPPPAAPHGARLSGDAPARPVRRGAEVFHPPRLSLLSTSL